MYTYPFLPPIVPEELDQRQRQLMPHPETVNKVLLGPSAIQLIPPHQRIEILKRPETQVLIQSNLFYPQSV